MFLAGGNISQKSIVSLFWKLPLKKTKTGAAGAESKENPAKTKDCAKREFGAGKEAVEKKLGVKVRKGEESKQSLIE